MQTFKNAMRANGSVPPLEFLPRFLLAYRSTPHATTNATPAFLLTGRQLRTRLSLVQPDVRSVVEHRQQAQAVPTRSHGLRTFVSGDSVITRDYRVNAKTPWVPGVIKKPLGSVHYAVEVCPGTEWRRHVDQIRHAGALPSAVGEEVTATANRVSSSLPDDKSEDVSPYFVQGNLKDISKDISDDVSSPSQNNSDDTLAEVIPTPRTSQRIHNKAR